ncbi:AAA family ATPase [Bacillus andreraoultii]|uniref:AAA family ATPase n=1 Tax=Bacillus andreraoultii TaxID=1499685 RepID=UPI00067E93DA|nr:AAA family ATPase [Bacillus andreraoultii]
MDLLLGYQNDGVDGLKKRLQTQVKEYSEKEQIINDLVALLKERQIKNDIDAQKVILQQLYELEAYKEAQKVCRKILIQKPNDIEAGEFQNKIKQRLVGNSNTSRLEMADSSSSLLEKNKRLFEQIEQEVMKEVIGQEKLTRYLSKSVQKSLLNTNPIHIYREAMLISSPKSQGVRTTINSFFNFVYKHHLIEEEQTKIIDMSQYDMTDGAIDMFYVDIYNAFMGRSRVTIFQNVDECPLDFINLLNSIVTNGYVPLDGRYTYQDGMLVKVNQMLVEGSFNLIEAKDQYLFFHTHEPLENVMTIFTESSQSKFSYKVTLDSLTDENVQKLFEKIVNQDIEKARTNFGINLYTNPAALSPAAIYFFNRGGATRLQQLTNEIYVKTSEFLLEHTIDYTETYEIVLENHVIKLKVGENLYPLLDMYKKRKRLASIENKIDQLVGLHEVKTSLKELKIFLQKREQRLSQGYHVNMPSLHFVFTGNPGTGKTTVARLLAEYLKAIGYLSEGHLIEVDRSNLVGKYVGHTASQTMNLVKAALGGVLFIDEAYALARGGENDFGREAIDTIVKAMEDYRDQLVVVFAGYPKEIEDLLELNPGLRSRVTQTFYFNDYTTDELLDISRNIAQYQGFEIEERALKQLREYYQKHQIKGKVDSGNGRLARQTIERAIKKQAVRTATPEDSAIDMLTLEDFGLEEKEEFNLESQLKQIIGLDHIKDLIRTLYKQQIINKRRSKLNPNFVSNQSLHFIFTGNPGTGKTTISRMVAELFKNIGILKKGHLVELARPELVAPYVGQTALKTEKVFKSALGGVLFIDEAYALANDQFGEEAINTLIKLMEDHKEDIIVVLAGYEEHMNQLLQVNPGIKSRFSNVFHFPDYSAEELYAIALHLFHQKGFTLNLEAEKALQNFIQQSYKFADGNGRYVRNIVEEMIRVQSNRIFNSDYTSDEELMMISSGDILSLNNREN